jgi:hypothetical protein
MGMTREEETVLFKNTSATLWWARVSTMAGVASALISLAVAWLFRPR